jgi:hypothetical protein
MKLQAADAFREGNQKEVDYLIQEVSATPFFWGGGGGKGWTLHVEDLVGQLITLELHDSNKKVDVVTCGHNY